MTLWRVMYDIQTDKNTTWWPDSTDHLGTDNGGEAFNFVMEQLLGKPHGSNEATVLAVRLRGLTALGTVRSFDPAAFQEVGVTVQQATG